LQEELPEAGAEEKKDEEETPVLYWFLLPLRAKDDPKGPPRLLAWEVPSRMGRATYFFRVPGMEASTPDEAGPVLAAEAAKINHALVLLNFRREPVYLPDSSLDSRPRYYRYAVARRRIGILANLRAAYAGRALHTSFEGWQKQVEAILART
jgi:hypothetical protein